MTSKLRRVVRREWSKVAQLIRNQRNKRMKAQLRSDGQINFKRDETDFIMTMWHRRGCVVNKYDMKEGK